MLKIKNEQGIIIILKDDIILKETEVDEDDVVVQVELDDLKDFDFGTFPENLIVQIILENAAKIEEIVISKLDNKFIIDASAVFCMRCWGSFVGIYDYVRALKNLLTDSGIAANAYYPGEVDDAHLYLRFSMTLDEKQGVLKSIMDLISNVKSVSHKLDKIVGNSKAEFYQKLGLK